MTLFTMERLRSWGWAAVVALLLYQPAFLPAQAPGGVAPGNAPPAPAAAAAAPAAAALAQGATPPLMPEVISTYGDSVDGLFYLILAITLFMLVLVFALFTIFVVRYRHQEGRRAKFVHGSTKLEWAWTSATAVVLIWLVFVQRNTWIEIKQKDLSTLKDPYLVRVFGEQFNWHFVYPGADGKFEPSSLQNVFQGINPVGLKDPKADKYSTVLMVPENVPVILELNSLGKYNQDTGQETLPVLHSFFSPNLRFKQDLVPFHPAKVWFQIKEKTLQPNQLERTFEIACAELCGQGHYLMRADFKVMSNEQLQKELGYDWKAAPAKF